MLLDSLTRTNSFYAMAAQYANGHPYIMVDENNPSEKVAAEKLLGVARTGGALPVKRGCGHSLGTKDLAAASAYIEQLRGCGPLLVYGISSGALRAALFAQNHPQRVARLALDAFVWTGEGSPTLEQRRQKLPQFLASKRRPIDRAFVHSIFTRDHPGTADDAVVDAFAVAITALDDSIPNGTYIDMCTRLPLVDPARISVPTIVMRGEYDGIAGFDDLVGFWKRLPNADKNFTVMAGISHASFQQKNYRMVYHILHAFFSQPAPAYRA